MISEDEATGFPLAEQGKPVRICVSPQEPVGVVEAVSNLGDDLESVCGCRSFVQETSRQARIVVATLGSPLIPIDFDLAGLYAPDGVLRPEAFIIEARDEQVFLVGSDARGTIFAVYDMSEAIGVSPWHWFADVPVRTRSRIVIPEHMRHVDWPAVAYRGIFVNDEEELDAWARRHTTDGTIGPQLYERIFELILRLKGNYIWPAMHVNAFHADPANLLLATRMGVVVGTSHCDILGRNNVHEWDSWSKTVGEPVEYDASLTGRNRELLLDYWRQRVQQCAGMDVTWTVGMRGIHDSELVSCAAEDIEDRVSVLDDVIRDQRALLHEVLGNQNSQQIFIPYKEVLDLYDHGLHVPDDVTLIWTDDNFGHMRRFPNEQELTRSGGHGLYYHCSYWSMPPRTYLFVGSTPLSQMAHELQNAWDKGINRIWVNNVGPIKRRELEMDFFLRMAWDVGKKHVDMESFISVWADRTFSGAHGHELADIWVQFESFNTRKPEHMVTGSFSQTSYGDEAARRVRGLRDVRSCVRRIMSDLKPEEQDGFFQLIAMKTEIAHLFAAEFYYADRSILAYGQSKMAAADRYLEYSRRCSDMVMAVIKWYNEEMSRGKWCDVLTPHTYPPPSMPLNPRGKPSLGAGKPGFGVVSEEETLVFCVQGSRDKWIEVYPTGMGPTHIRVTCDPWIDIDIHDVVIPTEKRIHVRIPQIEQAVGRCGRVHIEDDSGETKCVAVEVVGADLPKNYCGTVEADGFVSIDPRWGQEESSWCLYPFFLVTGGIHRCEIHRYPSLDATGRKRILVRVDDMPVTVVESQTIDEHLGQWDQAVRENREKLRFDLPFLEPGPHTFAISMLDEDFIPIKFVIYTKPRRWTALGPPLSFHANSVSEDVCDPDPEDLVSWDQDPWIHAERWVPPAAYVDRYFWGDNPMFRAPAAYVAPTGDAPYCLKRETAAAMSCDHTAWTTPGTDGSRWTHTQAETNNQTGLAMVVADEGRRWDDPDCAPGLYYRMYVARSGLYHVWLLVKFSSQDDDSCWIGLDSAVQPLSDQFSGGELYGFGTQEIWHWTHLADLPISSGEHVFSLHARKAGLRVARIYLTLTDEYPAPYGGVDRGHVR